MSERLGIVLCCSGVDAWAGGPSTCSPFNSLLAATFNTALFTGALWMKTQAAVCFKYEWLCVCACVCTVCE